MKEDFIKKGEETVKVCYLYKDDLKPEMRELDLPYQLVHSSHFKEKPTTEEYVYVVKDGARNHFHPKSVTEEIRSVSKYFNNITKYSSMARRMLQYEDIETGHDKGPVVTLKELLEEELKKNEQNNE
jgi:hypothetical protein